jgi:hypothetical protein
MHVSFSFNSINFVLLFQLRFQLRFQLYLIDDISIHIFNINAHVVKN